MQLALRFYCRVQQLLDLLVDKLQSPQIGWLGVATLIEWQSIGNNGCRTALAIPTTPLHPWDPLGLVLDLH